MSARRAVAWLALMGVLALVYVLSVAVSGEWRQNGAWFLLVVAFVGFGADNLRVVIAARGDSGE